MAKTGVPVLAPKPKGGAPTGNKNALSHGRFTAAARAGRAEAFAARAEARARRAEGRRLLARVRAFLAAADERLRLCRESDCVSVAEAGDDVSQ